MTSLESAVAALLPGERILGIAKLHGDGSAREFFRVATGSGTLVLMKGPDPQENAAYLRISRHLSGRGIRVPALRGENPALGIVLMEDLGDENLLDALKKSYDPVALYAPVLELLVLMQTEGAKGFTLATGFAPAPYGPELMVRGEGLYFAEEFASGMLGLKQAGKALLPDLEKLAALASEAPGGYFLHRDFQSRNIHRAPGEWAVLDFQGARPGPLAYDAAALIFDPYAALPKDARLELLENYLRRLGAVPGVDAEAVRKSFPAIGSFRMMQALGAYGKLGGRLGKPGFLEHSGAALAHLLELLDLLGPERPEGLNSLVIECAKIWSARTGKPSEV